MAVTIVKVFQGTNISINDVIATADGDVAATIPHGLGGAPVEVYLTPLLSQALTALSAWAVATPPATGITATNLVLTKLASTGSGNAVVQLRTVCKSPNSLGI